MLTWTCGLVSESPQLFTSGVSQKSGYYNKCSNWHLSDFGHLRICWIWSSVVNFEAILDLKLKLKLKLKKKHTFHKGKDDCGCRLLGHARKACDFKGKFSFLCKIESFLHLTNLCIWKIGKFQYQIRVSYVRIIQALMSVMHWKWGGKKQQPLGRRRKSPRNLHWLEFVLLQQHPYWQEIKQCRIKCIRQNVSFWNWTSVFWFLVLKPSDSWIVNRIYVCLPETETKIWRKVTGEKIWIHFDPQCTL